MDKTYVFMYTIAIFLWLLKPEELFKPSGKMKVFSMQQSDQTSPLPIFIILIVLSLGFLNNELKSTRSGLPGLPVVGLPVVG